jgi:hypothetical protein
METKNIEIETANKNIEKMSTLKFEDAILYAIANEREIVRLARKITFMLETLVRDLEQMAQTFAANGQSSLCNVSNNLPELKAVLQVRIEARNLYAELLK